MRRSPRAALPAVPPRVVVPAATASRVVRAIPLAFMSAIVVSALTLGAGPAAAAVTAQGETARFASTDTGTPDTGTAPATEADDPPASYGNGVLVYEGTVERSPFSLEGAEQEVQTFPITMEMRCVDGECSWSVTRFWLRYLPEGILDDGQVVATWDEPAFGTPCADEGDPDYYINSSVGTATAAVDNLIITTFEEPSPIIPCSETRSVTRWGSEYSLIADLVSGDPCVLDESLCIVPEPEPEPEPVVAAAPSPDVAPVTPSTPSTLSALATPEQTLAPQQVLTAALLTLILVILLALPTALLNSASSTSAEKVAAWRARLAARRLSLGSATPTGLRATVVRLRETWARASTRGRGLPLAAATLLAAAVMSGFVDPDFGLGASTPRVLLSIALGFTLEVLLGWVAMLILLPRLIAGVDARLDVRPATLLIVLGAVVVTRLTGFEPGIVFGLVAGVAVGATLATAARVRVALAGLGWGYGLAVLAWVTYAALEPAALDAAAASADGLPPLGLVLVQEALATMTMAGIAALPVALVPVRGLTGHEVWEWSKPLWAGLYALGLFSFFVVLMPMPFAWAGVEAALATWITGYLVYAAVAVTLWLVITQPWKPDAEPQPPAPERAAAEQVGVDSSG